MKQKGMINVVKTWCNNITGVVDGRAGILENVGFWIKPDWEPKDITNVLFLADDFSRPTFNKVAEHLKEKGIKSYQAVNASDAYGSFIANYYDGLVVQVDALPGSLPIHHAFVLEHPNMGGNRFLGGRAFAQKINKDGKIPTVAFSYDCDGAFEEYSARIPGVIAIYSSGFDYLGLNTEHLARIFYDKKIVPEHLYQKRE